MPGRKIFAGARLKAIRDQHRLTQAQLAARLDVSTSYVNQIENNQRPLTAAVMLALAEGFNLDLSELMSDKSDRLLADLREVLADPVFGAGAPSLSELKTVTSSAPSTAHAMLRLYEAYRKSAERLASMDDALAQQPGG
ncbi:MAG: helix-turn-helix domain-containing protein, partial [Cucumibacter sp.]